jgi:hypothetical protein
MALESRKDCFGNLNKMFVEGCVQNCPDVLDCYHKMVQDIKNSLAQKEKGGHLLNPPPKAKRIKKSRRKKKKGGA